MYIRSLLQEPTWSISQYVLYALESLVPIVYDSIIKVVA